MCRENCQRVIIAILACFVIFAGCKKDKPVPPGDGATPPIYTISKNVYVVCEGSYGNGNSALTLYRPTPDSAFEDVFEAANGKELGDVFQSMSLIGNNFFLCINNSDKVIAIDRNNWKQAGSIDISKPRYIVSTSETKAYVSSLYSNKVSIINPQTMELSGTVTMPGKNAEGMLLHKGNLYVALWDTSVNKLYSIDVVTNQVQIVQTLAGYAPKDVLLDREGQLWVLGGNIQQGKKASLTRIDPDNLQVTASFQFPADADPLKPVLNNDGNELYYIGVNYTGGSSHNGIYRMNINDASLPGSAFIPAQNLQYFWALGIEPGTGNIYVGDPLGFTQRGLVYIYDKDGNKLKDFACGVGPGHFYFDK